MIVLDTTVLVYAKGADHPLRDSCRRLVEAVSEGQIEATTTIEVIQELAHVRARRRGVSEAVSLARDYSELLAPLLLLKREHLDRGLTLFESVEGLGAFDAVLAAAAMHTGGAVLVSADRAFATVPELTHVFPDAQAVASVLASVSPSAGPGGPAAA